MIFFTIKFTHLNFVVKIMPPKIARRSRKIKEIGQQESVNREGVER